LHAEINATIKAPRGLEIAYCTDTPCESCATALVNYGVQELYYLREYRKTEGRAILVNSGVDITRMGSPMFPDTWPHKFTASVIGGTE